MLIFLVFYYSALFSLHSNISSSLYAIFICLNIALCSLVEIDRRFRGTYCLHYPGDRPEVGGRTHLWNVGLHLRVHTAVYPKSLSSSYSPSWELELPSSFFLWHYQFFVLFCVFLHLRISAILYFTSDSIFWLGSSRILSSSSCSVSCQYQESEWDTSPPFLNRPNFMLAHPQSIISHSFIDCTLKMMYALFKPFKFTWCVKINSEYTPVIGLKIEGRTKLCVDRYYRFWEPVQQ
jgi:hypothetical protein